MASVYFDESGFTGRDLLNSEQQFFVLVSTVISNQDAEFILRAAFPRYQGEEFKFQNIWRRYRQRLVPFCIALGERITDVFIWSVDKKFCVLQKLIDFLVEPVAHDAGYDFYRNAYAYRYSNYIYFGLNHIGTRELYDATVRAYFEFASDPSSQGLERLIFQLRIFASSAPSETRFFFETAALGAERFHLSSRMETFRDTLEIYVTSMLSHVSYWSQRTSGSLELYCDRSKEFFDQQELWSALTSQEVDEQWHPVANGPPVRFPLPVGSTTSVDSRSSPAIQLCDLLAGLAVKIKSREFDQEAQVIFEDISRTPFVNIATNGIQPGTDFPGSGPERLDGPDAVDLMTGIIRSGRQRSRSS